MQYDAAIFDLDGTLLDTIDDLKNSINHALSVCGYPPRTRAEVLAFVGNGVPRLVELAVPPGTPADRRQAVLDAMNAHYAAHCAELTRPYPGITDVLRTLRAAGMHVAVVSNKPDYGVQELCARYFPGLLDSAVGMREGIRKKPYPDAVEAALAAFGVPPERAVYIGDSEVDVQTAKNAHTALIAVDWGFRTHAQLVEAGAERIVSDADALFALLR